jgi:hypothetical protein
MHGASGAHARNSASSLPRRTDLPYIHREMKQGAGMPAYLRVYPRALEMEKEAQAPVIRIRLGDLFPLLAEAQRGNYLWLNDFEDDEVLISPDLYELIRAYECYRPSA